MHCSVRAYLKAKHRRPALLRALVPVTAEATTSAVAGTLTVTPSAGSRNLAMRGDGNDAMGSGSTGFTTQGPRRLGRDAGKQ